MMQQIEEQDRARVSQFIRDFWGSDRMASGGRIYFPGEHPGFIAESQDNLIGLITYEIEGRTLQISLLDVRNRRQGIGTALIGKVMDMARAEGCDRASCIVTNDNIPAIQFFQKCGFDLVRLHHDAMQSARQVKPEIPMTGYAGLPIRHELEFELRLTN